MNTEHEQFTGGRSLEQMRQSQARYEARYKTDDSPTILPDNYAKRVFRKETKSLADIIASATQKVSRPQKDFSDAMPYEDARKIVWAICQEKSAVIGKDFIVDDNNKSLIQNLIKYMIGDNSCIWDLQKGLFIFGGVGLGKTYLMSVMQAFVDAANVEHRKFKFHVCADIVDDVEVKGMEAMRRFYRPETDLCFDDLGQEQAVLHRYGNTVSVMETILTKRYANFINGKCVTHITTNLTPDEIEPIYGTRVADRMNEMFNYIPVCGTSRRG